MPDDSTLRLMEPLAVVASSSSSPSSSSSSSCSAFLLPCFLAFASRSRRPSSRPRPSRDPRCLPFASLLRGGTAPPLEGRESSRREKGRFQGKSSYPFSAQGRREPRALLSRNEDSSLGKERTNTSFFPTKAAGRLPHGGHTFSSVIFPTVGCVSCTT